MAAYVPDRGDVVRISFTPQAGHEQAGWRPALVLSPKAYNARVGLALFCPVTGQVKGYPFEVELLPEKAPLHVASEGERNGLRGANRPSAAQARARDPDPSRKAASEGHRSHSWWARSR